MGASAKTIDMTNVKERSFNTKRLPEGDYPALVKSVSDHKSKAGNFQWLYTLEIHEGKGKGASYPYYCGVTPEELWKVRGLFVAAGINVPKKKQKFDPNPVVNRKIGITLEDDEYDGKLKSKISGVLPVGEVGDAPIDADDDDMEEEQPKPKKKNKKNKKGKSSVTDDELEELDVEAI